MNKRNTWTVSLIALASCMADASEFDPNVGAYDDEDGVQASEEFASTSQAIHNAQGLFPRSLVRLDFPDGEWCSGFFIAPNMIAASSHCVASRREGGGNFQDMDWGHLQVRIVYKPASDEVMCINEPCRNSNGSRRYTTVVAWSDEDYDGSSDDSLAILTRVQGLDFPTRSADWNGTSPRALADHRGDFMRILDIDGSSRSTRTRAYGYGYHDRFESYDYEPRRGRQMVIDFLGPEDGRNEASSSPLCDGDEGGPAVLELGPWNSSLGIERFIASAVFSTNVDTPSRCGHTGSVVHWGRLDAKEWMIEAIMDWADRPGSTSCSHFAQAYELSGLDRVARYMRCW